MNIPLAARPRLASKARIRHDRLEGADVLLYPERGLRLNAVGSAVARRCDGTRNVGAIVDEIAASFLEVSRERVERDVIGFLTKLAERGLLEGLDAREP